MSVGTERSELRKLCERRSGRPGRPVPNSPYDLCGRQATLNDKLRAVRRLRTVHSSWKAETPCQNEERVTALALFWSIICASSICLWSSSVQSVYHGLQQTRGWPCPVLCHSPIGFSTVTIPSLVRQIGCATRRLDSEFFMDLARITSVCPWNHCTERGQGRLCRTNK